MDLTLGISKSTAAPRKSYDWTRPDFNSWNKNDQTRQEVRNQSMFTSGLDSTRLKHHCVYRRRASASKRALLGGPGGGALPGLLSSLALALVIWIARSCNAIRNVRQCLGSVRYSFPVVPVLPVRFHHPVSVAILNRVAT